MDKPKKSKKTHFSSTCEASNTTKTHQSHDRPQDSQSSNRDTYTITYTIIIEN